MGIFSHKSDPKSLIPIIQYLKDRRKPGLKVMIFYTHDRCNIREFESKKGLYFKHFSFYEQFKFHDDDSI